MKILLAGAGGYATTYLKALLKNKDTDICFEGIVDPYFSNCENKESTEVPVRIMP